MSDLSAWTGSGGSGRRGGASLGPWVGGGSAAPDPQYDSLGNARSKLFERLGYIAGSQSPDAAAEIAAATEGGGGGQNPLMRALSIIDKPRSVVVAGARQVGNALGNAVFDGPDDPVGWEAFKDDVGRNIGVGDILTEEGSAGYGADYLEEGEEGFRSTDIPINVRRGLGFAGDVAVDPLTYLAPQSEIAKLGTQGAARAAARHGLDDVAARIIQGRGVSALADDDLARLSAKMIDAGELEKPLRGGLYWNVPGSGAVGRRIQHAAGVRNPTLKQIRIAGRGPLTTGVARGIRKGANRVTDTRVGKFFGDVFTESQKRALTKQMREGTAEEAVQAFKVMDSLTRNKVRATAVGMEALTGLNRNLDELQRRGVDGEALTELLEAGPQDARWGAIDGQFGEGTAALAQGARDDMLEVFNAEARKSGQGGDLVPWRENYAPRSLTDEAREAFARKRKGDTMFDPSSIEQRANVVAGGKFMDEDLVAAVDHPQGLTPTQQAEEIARQKLGDKAVQIFETDFYENSRRWLDTAQRRLQGRLVEDDLLDEGVAAPLTRRVAEQTDAGREQVRLVQTLSNARLRRRTQRMRTAVQRSEADQAAARAARLEGGVDEAVDAQQVAQARLVEAERNVRMAGEPEGVRAAREYGESLLEASGRHAHAADLADMMADDAVARSSAVADEIDKALGEAKAAVSGADADLQRLLTDRDEAFARMADALGRSEREIAEATAKVAAADSLDARAAAVAKRLDFHEGRLPNGARQILADIDALDAQVAAHVASSEAKPQWFAARQASRKSAERVRGARQAAQEARDEIAEIDTALREVQPPPQVYRSQFDSDEAYEAAKLQWASENIDFDIAHNERLGAAREEALDRLAARLKRVEKSQQVHVQAVRQEQYWSRRLAAEEDVLVGEKASLQESLQALFDAQGGTVADLRSELEVLKRERAALGLTQELEQIGRIENELIAISDKGYLTWAHRSDEAADIMFHGSPDYLNLAAGREGNAIGDTLETDNLLGLHLAENPALAEGFGTQGGVSAARLRSSNPYVLQDAEDVATWGVDSATAAAGPGGKGASRGRLDFEMMLHGWESGVLDFDALADDVAEGSVLEGRRILDEAAERGLDPPPTAVAMADGSYGERARTALQEVQGYLDGLYDEVGEGIVDPTNPARTHAIQEDIGAILDDVWYDGRARSWTERDGQILEELGEPFDAVEELHRNQRMLARGWFDQIVNPPTMSATATDGLAVPDGVLVDHAALASGYKEMLRAQGFDSIVMPHGGGDGWQAIAFDNAQIEVVGGAKGIDAPASFGEDVMVPGGARRVRVPKAPEGPEEATRIFQEGMGEAVDPTAIPEAASKALFGAEFTGKRATAIDYTEWRRALVENRQRRIFEKHQVKVNDIGFDIERQTARVEDAKRTIADLQTRRQRNTARLASERAQLSAKKRAAIEEQNALIDRAQAIFDQADETERAAREAAQAEVAQRQANVGAAQDRTAAATSEWLQSVADARRLEAQAVAAEAVLADADRAVRSARKGVESIDPDDPKWVERVDMVLKDGFAQLGFDSQAPEEIVDVLRDVQRVMDPEGLKGFLRYFDKATTAFKAWAVATPGFHVRNYMGGVFNNYLAGVEGYRYRQFRTADKQFRKAYGRSGGDVEKALRAIKDPQVRKAYGVLQEARVLDSAGQVGSELNMTLNVGGGHQVGPRAGLRRAMSGHSYGLGGGQGPMGGAVWGQNTPANNVLTRVNFEGSTKVERMLRGTLALDVAMNGGSVDDAIGAVFKYHFDYDDLSRFERGFARRVIPFYTWTRKNLPLQIEQMVVNPKAYGRYYQLKGEAEMGRTEEEIIPSYYRGLMPIDVSGVFADSGIAPLEGMAEGGGVYLTPDLPFTQLGEQVEPGMVLGQANPLLKTPAELYAGKQFFSDIPFRGGYHETPDSWGFAMPALASIGMAHRARDGSWKMKDSDMYLVEQALPVMGRARRALPSEDKYTQRMNTTMASMLFGVGMRHNTPASKASELYRRMDRLDSWMEEQRGLGYGGYSEFSRTYEVTDDEAKEREA